MIVMKGANIYIGTKQTGVVIIIISLLLFISVYSFTTELNKLLHEDCVTPEGFCPHAGTTLPIQSYFGFTIALVLLIFGIFLLFSGRGIEKEGVERKIKFEKTIKTLQGDEQKVYESIAASDGIIFQAELIEKIGFSKVKVSRILDKLEAKGLLERRRRGMSNVIVIKR